MLKTRKVAITALVACGVLVGSVPAGAQTVDPGGAPAAAPPASTGSASCSATTTTQIKQSGSGGSLTVSSSVKSSTRITITGSGATSKEASSNCSAKVEADGKDATCSAEAEVRLGDAEKHVVDRDGKRCSAEASLEGGGQAQAAQTVAALWARWLW
jgi:hypothetical protein